LKLFLGLKVQHFLTGSPPLKLIQLSPGLRWQAELATLAQYHLGQ
jgi:hypothetical protein